MKLLLNSVIFTHIVTFMITVIKNFNLKTPMEQYKYLRLKLPEMSDDSIQEYELTKKATKDGFVYAKYCRGMYGLPQARILAQQLFKKRLGKHGYSQHKITRGFGPMLGAPSPSP